MKETKPIQFTVNIHFTDNGEAPALQAYAFTRHGKLLNSAPVRKASAVMDMPVEMDGRSIEIILGPQPAPGQPLPTATALKRMGAFVESVQLLKDQALLDLHIPSILFPHWCLCLVKGRLVKRITLPDGSLGEQPVCHARVHICEVDRIKLIIDKLPEIDLWRLRDDLLDKLKVIPEFPPIPEPIPGPDPAPFTSLPQMRKRLQPLNSLGDINLHALATVESTTSLRQQLIRISGIISIYLCDLFYLWPFFDVDCITTVESNGDGHFSSLIGFDCADQPDLYFWVEQFIDGAWQTVYRPGAGCGTYWNYACGTEIVLNLPGAVGCEQPDYDPPPGVTVFVLPYSIGNAPIWGTPSGAPAAPDGWVRSDGYIDYYSGSALGWLYDAPFGGVLNFYHDDSYFIPSAGIKYYRYSFKRPGDIDWTPIMSPLSRTYRMEYSDRLPTYQGYPVGPNTINGEPGLFEFKPQTPPPKPTDVATVVAREWVSGNVSEVAASWNTLLAAPAMSDTNVTDDAGDFDIKIEVFDPAGSLVLPGAGTFQFLLRNADGATTRLATTGAGGEVVGGAYVFRVHVDNNAVSSDLPQPSIGGIPAADDCGFLRYGPGDLVHIQFQAAHPHNHAVFGFGVKRGSNWLPIATTTGAYVETSAISAPTSGTAYTLSAGNYQHDFSAGDLVGACINAAFAADLSVYGKATNGYWRLGYDAHELIAFALARQHP